MGISYKVQVTANNKEYLKSLSVKWLTINLKYKQVCSQPQFCRLCQNDSIIDVVEWLRVTSGGKCVAEYNFNKFVTSRQVHTVSVSEKTSE